jgi:hypothetical protein
MAGMDWFRWHHGSVTDPKFALIARKSGASLPDVLAVWCYILETASQSVERGDFGTVDCEALDCVFGFPATETRTADILAAMQARNLTQGTRISSWEKRQPKREREDATNADRQAAFKAKKNQVTPDNANDNQKTPREEKRREEKNTNTPIPPKGAKACSSAISLQTWLTEKKESDEVAIPPDDPVFTYAENIGIPQDHLRLAWREFRERYSQPHSKRYKDWRAVFRKAVRGNWFKLWYFQDEGCTLTTAGVQAKRELEASEAAKGKSQS